MMHVRLLKPVPHLRLCPFFFPLKAAAHCPEQSPVKS